MATLTFDEIEAFETDNWKQKMSVLGSTLKKNQVRLILLSHGTFVGDDALGLFDLFEPISKTIVDDLREEGKHIINKLAKDTGNYTPEYAGAMYSALGQGIPCELFIWSSGNYHLARIKGLVELVQRLADKIDEYRLQSGDRVLLIGHSHAGQLFALLTTFLANDDRAHQLYEIMANNGHLKEDAKILANNLESLKNIYFDIATFGTPVRYAWGDYDKYRLLPVVNHRSPVYIDGLPKTRDGDYVQQWGVEGTDLPPPTFNEMQLNDKFDSVLDKGRDSGLLIDSIGHHERRQPKFANGNIVCESLLIDYKDEGLLWPNCVKTLFGHGVYTNYQAMLFNMTTLVKNWFS